MNINALNQPTGRPTHAEATRRQQNVPADAGARGRCSDYVLSGFIYNVISLHPSAMPLKPRCNAMIGVHMTLTARVAALFFLIALTSITTAAASDLKVVASIKPVHSLVASVMDGIGTPDLIVRGAASPHGYAMKPSDARSVSNAHAIFWIGPGLEGFLEKPLKTLGGGARVVRLGPEGHDTAGHTHP